MVGQLANVDAKIADRVANRLGLSSVSPVHTTVPARENLAPSPALSILGKAKPTLEGRMIGCLIADGSDTTTVLALESAVLKQKADFQLAGGASVLFDHVFLALSEKSATTLASEAAAVAWVHDAFQHLKVIGATPAARPLLEKAGVTTDEGVIVGADLDAYLAAAAKGKVWPREPKVRTIY
jgi:catalase